MCRGSGAGAEVGSRTAVVCEERRTGVWGVKETGAPESAAKEAITKAARSEDTLSSHAVADSLDSREGEGESWVFPLTGDRGI